MKIALFGATGAVGGYFLNKALAAGHEVTALVRSP
jgi:putative NADH-flavin reductase